MNELEYEGVNQRTMAALGKIPITKVEKFIKSKAINSLTTNGNNYRYSIDNTQQIIQNITNLPRNIHKKNHAFYNFKGGTGKTSICYQVSSHIALLGYKTLVIDADPQAHLSTSFGIANDNDFYTLYDCITNKQKIVNIIKPIYRNLDCIPANLSLTRLEIELNLLPRREERLKLELAEISEEYDFIFVDTNPTISILNRNVVTFTDVLNIVCETQPYSLNGLKLLIDDLNQYFKHMRVEPTLFNIIPNKYDDRTVSSAESINAMLTYYGDYIKPNFAVRKSEDIVTSSKISKPLAFFAKKNSLAAEDIFELMHYIIDISK